MNWLCRLGWHDPAAPVHWESGYYVGRCRRCGRDLLRMFRGSWRSRRDVMVRWHNRQPLGDPGLASEPTSPARGSKSGMTEDPVLPSETGFSDRWTAPVAEAAPASKAAFGSDAPATPAREAPRPNGGNGSAPAPGALLLLSGLIIGAALAIAGKWLLPAGERAAPAVVHSTPAPIAATPVPIPADAAPQPSGSTVVAVREGPCRGARFREERRGRRDSLQLRIEEEDGHWLTLSRAGTPCWVLVSGRRR